MSLVKLLTAVVAVAMIVVVPQPVAAKPSQVPETLAIGRHPVIASDSQGHLHIVFEEGKGGEGRLYYLQSIDQGKDWTKPVELTSAHGLSHFGNIAVGNDFSLDVVWTETKRGASDEKADIYFARSHDGGKTFSPDRAIFNSACKDSGPAIAVGDDGAIHILWCELHANGVEKQIFYSSSTDNGSTWSAKQLLALENHKEGAGLSSQPTIGISDDGVIHASWVDTIAGKNEPDIFYSKSEKGVWSKPMNVSRSARIAQQPVIACGRHHKVFLTWVDNSRKEMAQDIWCSVDSHEAGFSPPFNISDTPGVSSQPSITADHRGRVVIVWSDTTSGLKKPDIFGRVSLDSLADFSNLIDFSNTEGISLHPRAAIAGDRLFVVWEEDQGAVSKVFIKSMSLIGVATGPTPKVDQEIHGSSSTNR
jgi:BNR repeat-like domain